MLLLTETWLAAWCWLSACTSLFDGLARFGQALFDPGQRHRQRGAAALQAARELGHEGARHRRLGAHHVGDDQDQVGGRLLRHGQHLVGPARGAVTLFAAGGDAGGDAAQVLDQRQPQHDRDRPQLAEQQRLHALVGRHEAAQDAAADAAVAVRDQLAAPGRRRAAARPRRCSPNRAPGVATRGCSRAAGGAARCGSLPRSGRSCRAATPPPV